MKTAREISEFLNGKKYGAGYMALCPAHDDKNPSLSINEKDGKPLLHCHAGCPQEQVIASLKKLGLWQDKNSETTNTFVKHVEGLTDRVISYKNALSSELRDYIRNERLISDEVIEKFDLGQNDNRLSIPIKNPDGRVEDIRLYLPAKYRTKANVPKVMPTKNADASPKLFPAQVLQPFGTDNHENLGNLENLEKDQFLLLCEGEMDALTANSAGFRAITNTCGAGVWNEEFSELITETKLPVVILLDNDIAGEEGAIKRAESLTRFDVKTYVANWPVDRNQKHDITDELKLFGVDSLYQIIRKATRHSEIIYLDEVVAEEVKWLVKPYISIGKTTLIEGEPGIGKSFSALAFAALTSIGGANPFDENDFIPEGKVLLMSAEDGLPDTIKPRLEKMESNLKKIFAPREIFTLDDKGFETLNRVVEKEKPILVVLDPLTPFLDGKKDVNKASDMRPFFKNLANIAVKNSCAILVTRHLAKNVEQKGVSRGLGSIDISAAVRSILQVTHDSESKEIKRVTHIKSNIGAKGPPFGYTIKEGVFSWVTTLSAEEEADEPAGELERACSILNDALKDGPMNAKDIYSLAKEMSLSKSTLSRAKKKLRISSKKTTDSGKTVVWQWYILESQGYQDCHDSQATRTIHYNDPETYKDKD